MSNLTDGNPPRPILRYFEHNHLPPALAEVARMFHALAHELEGRFTPDTDPAEHTTALRKLLEAKDAAVRAHL
ncbi:hypothetical protein [Actinokineospora enzanensis]|uniref:hypothetical protein n=1 Tax=Actinokineospora enzanensis TaxID=155975 RepID=UPI00047696E4|nr:hypothetical protein [Actinokineospora enzanensis]